MAKAKKTKSSSKGNNKSKTGTKRNKDASEHSKKRRLLNVKAARKDDGGSKGISKPAKKSKKKDAWAAYETSFARQLEKLSAHFESMIKASEDRIAFSIAELSNSLEFLKGSMHRIASRIEKLPPNPDTLTPTTSRRAEFRGSSQHHSEREGSGAMRSVAGLLADGLNPTPVNADAGRAVSSSVPRGRASRSQSDRS
jgi:hypothetical protein